MEKGISHGEEGKDKEGSLQKKMIMILFACESQV
jgi:hypothetical protein